MKRLPYIYIKFDINQSSQSYIGKVSIKICDSCSKYKRAVIARFHNVAEGNISRLRDAQAFHAAVK